MIQDYWDAGIRHIVALRGDPPGSLGGAYTPRADGYQNATELTAGIRAIGDFDVSVGVYPQIHPESPSVDHDIDVLKAKGLSFMDSPGYDPCSATGQIASGANLIVFTTGRGSVFGAKPAP